MQELELTLFDLPLKTLQSPFEGPDDSGSSSGCRGIWGPQCISKKMSFEVSRSEDGRDEFLSYAQVFF